MKKYILSLSAIAFFSCANTPQINQTYNKPSNSSWLILNHIKFEKSQTFYELLMDKVYPAIFSYKDPDSNTNNANKEAQKFGRLFKPLNMNEDSTWTYIFMADPFIDNSTTSILKPLEQKYGNDESQKILDVWSSCFTSKGQESFFGQDILFSSFKNKIKPKPGNTIMIVLNYIKPNMNQNFERLTLNDILPVVAEYRDPSDDLHALNQKAFEEMRFMRPRSQNKDKSWSYVFMGDPYIDGANYLITKPFIQKYGEENVENKLKETGWNDSFNKDQVSYLLEEVDLTIF
tara:strand:+ start:100 stop:966 length:867 start_codon:yes stop_codon:yes gene_type:complete